MEKEKPATILVQEFQQNIADALNNSHLPAWLMEMLLQPFMTQLNQLAQMEREQAEKNYEGTDEGGE